MPNDVGEPFRLSYFIYQSCDGQCDDRPRHHEQGEKPGKRDELSPCEEPPRQAAVQEASIVTGNPILVVDDDTITLQLVADILQSEGYPVKVASNGVEALQALDQIQPALILLDMNMPLLDGRDFVRILQERQINLPILVMTAAQDANHCAQELGVAGYVAKPFPFLSLIKAVERAWTAQAA
jgi:CheY-like chemotaxis protein